MISPSTQSNINKIISYHLNEMDKYSDFNLKDKIKKDREYRRKNKRFDEPSLPFESVPSNNRIIIS
ncbi:MAG: hypothetical protein M0R17_05210 [Candidatus Omnitrophica bacterium]|jgi:hypothetical protein|nr:hypothetical protein [Candidatus Omnitrophota bacterium]